MHVAAFLAVQKRTHHRAQALQQHLDDLASVIEAENPKHAAQLRAIGERVWLMATRYLQSRMAEASSG